MSSVTEVPGYALDGHEAGEWLFVVPNNQTACTIVRMAAADIGGVVGDEDVLGPNKDLNTVPEKAAAADDESVRRQELELKKDFAVRFSDS